MRSSQARPFTPSNPRPLGGARDARGTRRRAHLRHAYTPSRRIPTGKCYDNWHNLVEDGCFDLPDSTNTVISYYPSLYGFVLSAALKGHPDWDTPLWSVAPPLSTAGEFTMPLKQGRQFVPTLDARQTQVFEAPDSQYTTNVGVHPPPTRRSWRSCQGATC